VYAQLSERSSRAEEALIRLAYERSAAYADRGETDEAQPYRERHVRLAEARDSREHLANALLGLARGYSNTRAPLTALSLNEAAAGLAREHRLPVHLARALMNAATEILPRDLHKVIQTDREALASAKQCGVVGYVRFTAVNLCLALWTGGLWDELMQLIQDHAEADLEPAIALISDVIQSWVAGARGTPFAGSVGRLGAGQSGRSGVVGSPGASPTADDR
jgi:hypothetical protein